MFVSNAKYYLKSTVSVTDSAGATFLLSADFERAANLETGTDTVSVVFKNGRQIERLEITATGGVGTIVKRGLDQSAAKTEVSSLKKEWIDGTVVYVTALASDLLDVDKTSGVSTVTSDTDFSGSVRFLDTMKLPTFADTTARDAVYTAPVNGDKCFIPGTGEQNYDGGAWHTLDVWTPTPNASETVAGKVEIATQAETDAGTETGGTGAVLSVTPKTLLQHVTNVTASQAEAEAGSSNVKLMTPLATQKKIDYTRASDAEATAGTDTVKFVTPKQAKDNYGTTVVASDVVIASSVSGSSTTSTSYVKAKEFVCNKAGKYRVAFTIVTSSGGSTVYGRIYKNGVAFGTERSTGSTSDVAFTEDLAFASGDLIQIYNKAAGATCTLGNAYVKASAFPTSAIPTVNL